MWRFHQLQCAQCLAGHTGSARPRQLPLCGQRVTLGEMLSWGDTVSLPAGEIRRVSWPRSQRDRCVLSKHLVQDKNAGCKHGPTLRRWSYCFPINPEQAREGRAAAVCSTTTQSSCSLLKASHAARAGLWSRQRIAGFERRPNPTRDY